MLGFAALIHLCAYEYDCVEISKSIIPINKNRPTIEEQYGIKKFNSQVEDRNYKFSDMYISDSWTTKYRAYFDKDARFLCLKYNQTSIYSGKSWSIVRIFFLRSERVYPNDFNTFRVYSNDFSTFAKLRCENPAWALSWYEFGKLYK